MHLRAAVLEPNRQVSRRGTSEFDESDLACVGLLEARVELLEDAPRDGHARWSDAARAPRDDRGEAPPAPTARRAVAVAVAHRRHGWFFFTDFSLRAFTARFLGTIDRVRLAHPERDSVAHKPVRARLRRGS